jgi:hypothetical protein
MFVESWTFEQWYREPGRFGKGSRSERPLCWMSMKPSSMSMFGVPYSPMVPSFTRWASGAKSRMANSTFSVLITLLYWVNTACSRLIWE